MQPQEAWQLLTLASARDGRTVDRAVATVWADDLAGIDLYDAADAIKAHYQESTEWLMPAHIIRGVRKIHAARERNTPRPSIPARTITLDRALLDKQTAWFIAHPGATVEDYEKAHNT